MFKAENPRRRAQPTLARGERYQAKPLDVLDGDSITFEVTLGDRHFAVEVRLFGLDAPEHSQPLGAEATDSLHSLVQQHQHWALLVTTPTDHYGRAVCLVFPSHLSPDQSLNRRLVELGMAYWDPNYAVQGEYGIAQAEVTARIRRRGVWKDPRRGEARPWDHRMSDDEDDFLSEQRELELRQAQARISEVELTAENHKETVRQLNVKLRSLAGDNSQIRSQMTAAMENLARASSDNADLQLQLDDERQRHEQTTEQLAELQDERRRLLDEIDESHRSPAKKLLREAAGHAKHLQREGCRSQAQSDRTRGISRSTENHRSGSPVEVFLRRNHQARTVVDNERLRESNANLTNELQRLRGERQDLRSQLKRAELNNARLASKAYGNERLETKPIAAVHMLESEVKALSAERDRLQKLLVARDDRLRVKVLRRLLRR